MRQLSVNDFYAWGLFLITTYCCIWWFPSAHITRAVHSFVLKDYIILGIALHLIWSSTGSIAGQVSGDWMGRVQTGLLYYSMSCCFQLTHEDGYLLSKAASWAFYSLGLSCFPVMYAKEHEALSWVSSGANSRTSRAEVLPTQDLFSWAGSESGLERSWEGRGAIRALQFGSILPSCGWRADINNAAAVAKWKSGSLFYTLFDKINEESTREVIIAPFVILKGHSTCFTPGHITVCVCGEILHV